jgi:hypothetical protein
MAHVCAYNEVGNWLDTDAAQIAYYRFVFTDLSEVECCYILTILTTYYWFWVQVIFTMKFVKFKRIVLSKTIFKCSLVSMLEAQKKTCSSSAGTIHKHIH